MRLKPASSRLTQASRARNPPPYSVGGHISTPRAARRPRRRRPSATLAAGPAAAMRSSTAGSSGNRSILEMPPIGRSSISTIGIPLRSATRLWLSPRGRRHRRRGRPATGDRRPHRAPPERLIPLRRVRPAAGRRRGCGCRCRPPSPLERTGGTGSNVAISGSLGVDLLLPARGPSRSPPPQRCLHQHDVPRVFRPRRR